jgi:hypothetical protein
VWKDLIERAGRQAMGKRIFGIVKSCCLVLLLFALVNCRDKKTDQEQVVIYTSLDKIFSEPILKAFERQAGIKVLDVYDSEATKTTGLVNRLIAEKNNPRADVFWNSEIGRTIVLKLPSTYLESGMGTGRFHQP